MEEQKLKLYVTSTALVLGFVCVTYLIFRRASNAFRYLTIKTVSDLELCEEVVGELRRRSTLYKTLGFDCEWVTEHGKRKPVALMQLASHDGYCGLFRLCQFKTIPDALKNLLEDKGIYKVGVAPCDDARYLYQDYSVALESSLDVRHIVKLAGYDSGGLASLSKSLLGVTMDKSWRVRCSDWEAEELSQRQVQYAAADAYVAVKIFVKIVNIISRQNSWSLFRNYDIWNNLDKLCGHYLNMKFKIKNNNPEDSVTMKKTNNYKKREKPNTATARSKPLYTNSFLEAPDGELLCTCDHKKALWYIEKELADVVKETPFTVRLRFEPVARSVGVQGKYYQIAKENMCVMCGATNSYIKKNVVPREYRKYFPEVMKDHSCHDVLLLCLPCHQRSNIADLRVRLALAEQCNAPLANKDSTRFTEDYERKKVKSAARALLTQGDKIPQQRREQLEGVVRAHYPQRPLAPDLLHEAATLQVYIENAEYSAHGQKVVEYFVGQEGGLPALEALWRRHFLRTRPLHMPPYWSVAHNEERSAKCCVKLRERFLDGRLTDEDLKSLGLSSWIKERETLGVVHRANNG